MSRYKEEGEIRGLYVHSEGGKTTNNLHRNALETKNARLVDLFLRSESVALYSFDRARPQREPQQLGKKYSEEEREIRK